MKNKRRLLTPVLIVIALAAAACSPPRPTPTPPPPTARPTVRPTAAPQPSPSATVVQESGTATPIAPPTHEVTNVPNIGNCTNRYAFVSDISVPDDTIMSPGQVFTKTWRVRNTGTCTWGEGYTLDFASGQAMTAMPSIFVPRTSPDQTADLSVLMTAPNTAGTFQGYWALKNPGGVPMTPLLWVKIKVQ